MSNAQPIGIFDSGVGGLSVAKSVQQRLPNEHILYVADSRYAPYGGQSKEYIRQRCETICQFLLQRNAKAIVVACNTATVSCIAQLREQFDVPIIGMEPGIKPAAIHSKTGAIGVLTTEQTSNSLAIVQLKERFSALADIHVTACPGLVDLVENLSIDTPEAKQLLQQYLNPLLEKNIDTLVLGCTHYAFLSSVIRTIIGSQVRIINTQDAVACELERRLNSQAILNHDNTPCPPTFFTNAQPSNAQQIISTLWGSPIDLCNFA